ncbi:restriction endonuclease subunit S [Lactiplantibacillus plantarum]|uniref:restriction endonuclease subunit S n=1 Tax=Lactiplantibacillus plantarum TaxID=1590 RepID=UPI00097570D4|nr:restriction endonuclease subunit S [Lactiplantibacillus plantarum]TLQ24572.1 restriction endonuclease subunit S [Lactiplantibacillus plantarum]
MKDQQASYPQLRFKGFTDPWEQRKLENVILKLSGGASIKPSDYSDEGVRTIPKGAVNSTGVADLSGSKFISREFFEKNKSSHASTNNLVTSLRDLVPSAPNMGRIVRIEGEREDFLMPQGVYKLELFDRMDEEFLIAFSNSDKYRKIISVEKNGSTQVHIRNGEFLNIDIELPTAKEQQKIGSFFNQLDDTIALHQRKLAKLKELKQGYLQKLFPRNGSKFPQLRFAGFADAWEERKLGEFSDVRDGTHASPKYVSQGHPMVTSKNLTHSGLDMTDVSFLTDKDFNEINKRSKVSIGDILFGMIGTIGNPVIVDRDGFAIKNVALIKEKASNPITNKWLLQYLKSPSFNRFIQKENAGGTQKFIALGLIRDMKLRVPEFDEQQKIGAFFKKIDDTIALHQRKLEKLQELKKGYLQKMFC